MIVSDFFDEVNDAYRGTDDDAPIIGSTDGDEWLRVTNRLIRAWARAEGINWGSLFTTLSVGMVSAGVQSYNIGSTFLKPANRVLVTTTSSQKVYLDIIKPEEKDECNLSQACYITGPEGARVLNFLSTINASDNIVGGAITIDCFAIPTAVAGAGDIVPVDDVNWLTYAVAAELAFNDLTYEDKAADLQGKANNAWTDMVLANRRGSSGAPRKMRTVVNRIRTGWR